MRSTAAATLLLTTGTLVGSLVVAISKDGGGLEVADACPKEHLDALVEIGYHGEEVLDSDWISMCIQGGDDGLILHVKPREDERRQLILPDRFAYHRKLIGESTHVPEVDCRRLVALLGVGDRGPNVVDAGELYSAEHVAQGRPNRM